MTAPVPAQQPVAILRGCIARMVRQANGPDVPVFQALVDGAWQQVAAGHGLAGVARLLSTYRNLLSNDEAEAVRQVLARTRAAGIDADAQLRGLKRAVARANPRQLPLAAAPVQRPPVARQAPAEAVDDQPDCGERFDVTVRGHAARICFDPWSRAFKNLKMVVHARGGVFSKRERMESYWTVPSGELAANRAL